MKNKVVSALLLTAGATAASLTMGCTVPFLDRPACVYGPPEDFGYYDTEYEDEDLNTEDTEQEDATEEDSEVAFDPDLEDNLTVYGPPEFFD